MINIAEKQSKTLQTVHNNIMKIQQGFFKYDNKKQKITSLLKKKNKVYLLTKNFKTKKSSKKLNYMKIDSFSIKEILTVNSI